MYKYALARITPVLQPQAWPCLRPTLRSRIPRCRTCQCLPPTPLDDSPSWRRGWSICGKADVIDHPYPSPKFRHLDIPLFPKMDRFTTWYI